MMSVKNFTYNLLFLILLGSCISPPDNFPSVPEVAFKGMEFVSTNSSDSLIVSITFKDAEGDLGLNATDVDPPFNALEFKRDNTGALILYGKRPSEAPQFNPIDWAVNPTVNNIVVRDTVWVEQNQNHNNIFVKFFIKRNGVFSEFRWENPPFYTTFNGRFPRILNNNNTQAVEGTIRYSMLSFGWQSLFRNDTIRIDVQIQDRALNKSNIVSSPEVTLSQISRR
ncbi:hypothetical protein P872_24865 [Rhodonellum psychrophilum GCM71 = DSM 17998]|uniref:NigD-like C-terminal beta sandwich domain-containing protein n=2 Tax=Rhodonellum TaxID=336827 RepID=U5C8V8_9BACT|nr:hypothetical protein P872_24865 [Rhodonellum psychrophilum GCM71 = DSM 17998]SDY87587.1 hypothetical protein SAMN05444412_103231 [Rhodonellum ikkaensis]